MATVEIIPIPLGSQLVKNIGANDPEDLNDFTVLLVFDGNITGLTEAGITLSAGATLVSLEGLELCLEGEWCVRLQTCWNCNGSPSQRNAVAEGNAQTSKEIEVVTSYPDTDAETPTLLFNHSHTCQCKRTRRVTDSDYCKSRG